MTIAICITIFVLGVAGAVAYRLAHRHDTATPPAAATKTVTVRPKVVVADPRTVVQEFYDDINNHHYAEAWRLTPETGGAVAFAKFRAGYAETAYDYLTIESVNGNVVNFSLRAAQNNGTVRSYAGTYTVINGIITAPHVTRVS